MMRRVTRWTIYACLGWSVAVIGGVGGLLVGSVRPVSIAPTTFGIGPSSMIGIAILGITWATVGAVLVIRRPHNRVGRLMVVIGAGFAITILSTAVAFAALAGGSPDAAQVASIAGGVTATATPIIVLMGYVPFIFPTGYGSTPRWHTVGLVYLAVCLTSAALQLLQPGDVHLLPGIRNPIGFGPDLRPIFGDRVAGGLDAIGAAIFLPIMILAVRDRYRRAGETERLQIKWFALAALLTVVVIMAMSVIAAFAPGPMDQSPLVGLAVAGTTIPVAIGIAILRHHLFDIDRLISRTLSYTVVTAALAGAFALTAVSLGTLLGSQGERETFQIAGATLVMVALFGPFRRRAQRAVDRRFDRARYDGERTAIAFSVRLRDETDMATVTADLARTAASSVAPSTLSIWLRPRRGVRT